MKPLGTHVSVKNERCAASRSTSDSFVVPRIQFNYTPSQRNRFLSGSDPEFLAELRHRTERLSLADAESKRIDLIVKK